MNPFRKPRVLKRLRDGTYRLDLDPGLQATVVALLRDLALAIEEDPHNPVLDRLRPPAYTDDPDREAGYQLLAGDELRSSRQTAIEASIAAIERGTFTEDELWSWLQSLNAVRLVVGTRLEITDDLQEPPALDALDAQERSLWEVYHFTTAVQHLVIDALGS